MIQIDDKKMRYLEESSHIALSDEERVNMIQGVQKLMDRIAELKKLDTKGVSELINPLDAVNVFRDDKVEKSLERKLLLKNAHNKNEDMFIAPKTVE